MSSEKLPPEPPKPSAKAAERLAVIVDAAERAALSVIDDAEKEAQRYLEEAKAHADRIAAERLRETADELDRKGGRALTPPTPASPSPPPARPVPPAPPAASPQGPPPGTPGREAEDVPVDGEAVGEADDDRNPTPSEEASRPVERLKVAPEPASPPEEPSAPADSPRPGSAAARLLATQMAVSGSSRQEIEMRLRNGFEIEDTGEILDAILGPEG
jgi:hypothetical protein